MKRACQARKVLDIALALALAAASVAFSALAIDEVVAIAITLAGEGDGGGVLTQAVFAAEFVVMAIGCLAYHVGRFGYLRRRQQDAGIDPVSCLSGIRVGRWSVSLSAVVARDRELGGAGYVGVGLYGPI